MAGRGGEVQLGRAGARTVVKNASCTAADASCEQEGARAGGAALSTTATRTRRAALAERRRPGSAAAAAGANVDSAARPPPGATAFPGGANACTRPRSQSGRNVRRGHERVATRRPPGCTHRIGTTPRAILHRTGDPRVPCAAVEWHGLMVRYGHGSATAIGALGRRSPGQPVAAQSSPGARRTQQADVVRDLRALRATTRRRPPSTGVVRDSSPEAQTSNLG